MKLLIATPAYDGKVNVQYAVALSESINLLSHQGIKVDLKITAAGSLLVAERNRLLDYFRLSDCTHMLCIDSDLGWPCQAIPAMLQSDLEFVAGCYPARGIDHTFLFRDQKNPDGTIVQGPKGHLKMDYIPAGFMLLKKSVIEKMVAKFPNLYFKSRSDGSEGYCFFDTEVYEGEFWGEDFVFCRRAREAGVDIWVDPLIEFDHAGTRGMLASCLKKKDEVDLTTKGSV